MQRENEKQNRGERGGLPSLGRVLARAAEMASRGERLPLKDDVTFKMFLSSPEPESQACLRYFLSAMTGREEVLPPGHDEADDGNALTDRLKILFFDLKLPGQIGEDLKRAAASLTGSQ